MHCFKSSEGMLKGFKAYVLVILEFSMIKIEQSTVINVLISPLEKLEQREDRFPSWKIVKKDRNFGSTLRSYNLANSYDFLNVLVIFINWRPFPTILVQFWSDWSTNG